ncbi:MAG: thiamine phosphate synthase [Planctomycetes bacterium]|nr:thiamine phosphate synthase [Planctomycetota bacterium]
MPPHLARILDANANRAREALRVLEEHCRMVLDDGPLTQRVKDVRHELAAALKHFGADSLLAARDTEHDVGTTITTESESHRADTQSVAVAAAKRAAESLRCMEEYGKITNAPAAAAIEQLRYRVYTLEQDILIGGPRRARLRTARLHVLVTASLCKRPWLDVCTAALAGGADVIQLREKELPDTELLARAKSLREITARANALLIINDRPDIARLADADGVHLGQTDLPVAAAREIVGANRLIGVSTHSLAEARAAIAAQPDYLGVGPMFASPTKPHVAVQGPKLLSEIAAITLLPLAAIGGINASNARDILAASPRAALAVSHAILSADDCECVVRALVDHSK